MTPEEVLARHVWSSSYTYSDGTATKSYCSCGKPWPFESDAVLMAREALAQKERAERLEGALRDMVDAWGANPAGLYLARGRAIALLTPPAPTLEGEKL